VELRWISWSERTAADAPLVKLRQQRHRLRETVRPREAAPADMDPWRIAADALSELKQIKVSTPQAREHLANVAEAIRRLAWGPDD
jgi:hypothetical protein